MSLEKKLYFDNDVLEVIRSMEFSDDGLSGKLTCGQLERKMYESVNKALEAMGGKWNRKSGSHVFKTDPRQTVDGLINNGILTVDKDGFFETPRKVVERMLELVPLDNDDDILEPSAGLGAIARILSEINPRASITVLEKNSERRAELIKAGFITALHSDFLTYGFNGFPTFDKIYMNPPFEELQDIDHVKHAYELLNPGGQMVSVMSVSPFFRSNKKAKDFINWLTGKGGYSEPLPKGSFKESGTGVDAVLVVLSRNA